MLVRLRSKTLPPASDSDSYSLYFMPLTACTLLALAQKILVLLLLTLCALFYCLSLLCILTFGSRCDSQTQLAGKFLKLFSRLVFLSRGRTAKHSQKENPGFPCSSKMSKFTKSRLCCFCICLMLVIVILSGFKRVGFCTVGSFYPTPDMHTQLETKRRRALASRTFKARSYSSRNTTKPINCKLLQIVFSSLSVAGFLFLSTFLIFFGTQTAQRQVIAKFAKLLNLLNFMRQL